VRGLAVALLAMVCVQGLMGGLRVTGSLTLEQDPGLLQPSTALAIAHGVFGQLVFAAAAAMAALTSARWLGPSAPQILPGAEGVRLWSALAPCVLLAQLFLGAAYRHLQVAPQGSEEAIRHPTWAMHGHLGFSIVAIIAVLIAASRLSAVGRERASARPMALSAQAMVALVIVQVGLGFVALAAVLMRRGADIPTSAHQATGALLLMAAVQGALWSRRLVAAPQGVPELSSPAASA
jgi:heme A synthase